LDKDAAGKPELWGKKGVKPITPKVGILADKWVQTAIAAVADRPEQLKALFTNKDYPAEVSSNFSSTSRENPLSFYLMISSQSIRLRTLPSVWIKRRTVPGGPLSSRRDSPNSTVTTSSSMVATMFKL